MTMELLKLKQALGELTVEDLHPKKLTQLSDYFDADVLGKILLAPDFDRW